MDGPRRPIDFAAARAAYLRGANVIDLLRTEAGLTTTPPEIIEAAYDLQAGSYVAWLGDNQQLVEACAGEFASLLDQYLSDQDAVLDMGAGELTTLSLTLARLNTRIKACYALDASWSRLSVGGEFARSVLPPALADKVRPFVAEMASIPLRSKSIDVTVSYHGLEPNHGTGARILGEIFRVTRRKAILLEPNYEAASAEAQQRMERFGYIRELEATVSGLGGTVDAVLPMRHLQNALNPTFAYIITPPPGAELAEDSEADAYTDPGTDDLLRRFSTCYFSRRRGVAYPIIEGLPILKTNAAVIASGLVSR